MSSARANSTRRPYRNRPVIIPEQASAGLLALLDELGEEGLARLDDHDRLRLRAFLTTEGQRLRARSARSEGAAEADAVDLTTVAGIILSGTAYVMSVVDIASAGNATTLGWTGLALSWVGLMITAFQEQRRADRTARRDEEKEQLTARLAALEHALRLLDS